MFGVWCRSLLDENGTRALERKFSLSVFTKGKFYRVDNLLDRFRSVGELFARKSTYIQDKASREMGRGRNV
jgi:hypothetical protein